MKPSDNDFCPASRTPASEQQWQAVLYALGEGTPEERLAFEEQMENDCALCEELIQATRLIDLAKLAPPSPVSAIIPESAVIPARRRGATVVALGSLALTLGFIVTIQKEPAGVSCLTDAVLLTQVEIDSLSTSEPETDAPEGTGEELGPPDWLFTALELEEQSGSNPSGTTDGSEI